MPGLNSPPTVTPHSIRASRPKPRPTHPSVAPILTAVVVAVPVIPGVRVVPGLGQSSRRTRDKQHKANQEKHQNPLHLFSPTQQAQHREWGTATPAAGEQGNCNVHGDNVNADVIVGMYPVWVAPQVADLDVLATVGAGNDSASKPGVQGHLRFYGTVPM